MILAVRRLIEHLVYLILKKVLCTDISKHVIDAKKFKNIEYAVMPMQHMNKIGDGAFDFIHISHVFEHVDEVDHDKWY